MLETGRYFDHNQKKLDSVSERQWADALELCRSYIILRLKKRTTFGAHTGLRLGDEAEQYYTAYAYEAILSGDWKWKDEFTLAQQMIRIAGSTISTEVEKFKSERENREPFIATYDDVETMFYEEDLPISEMKSTDQMLIDLKIQHIEEVIKDDHEFEFFWDCIKEGMKPAEIAVLMEVSIKQLYKLRERFVKKIKSIPYFEIE